MSSHIECDDLLALAACSVEEQFNAELRVSLEIIPPLPSHRRALVQRYDRTLDIRRWRNTLISSLWPCIPSG